MFLHIHCPIWEILYSCYCFALYSCSVKWQKLFRSTTWPFRMTDLQFLSIGTRRPLTPSHSSKVQLSITRTGNFCAYGYLFWTLWLNHQSNARRKWTGINSREIETADRGRWTTIPHRIPQQLNNQPPLNHQPQL